MDEMKIQTRFIQSIIENVIQKELKKKLGYDIDVQFTQPIRVTFDDKDLNVNVSVEASIPKEAISKIIKDII